MEFTQQGFREIEDRFLRDAQGFEALSAAAIEENAPELFTASVDALKAVTPKGETERLAESTEVADRIQTATSLSFTLRQPAMSEPNMDGSGGGFKYARTVIEGRGAIVAPSMGPYSTGKKALAGPGFGPVKRVGPAAPNFYPLLAEPGMVSAVQSFQARWSDEVLGRLL